MKLIKLSIGPESKSTQLRLPSIAEVSFNFKGLNTLITSNNKNSQGKTTLLRFLLFSLGYEIPLTDGVNRLTYMTTLEVEFQNQKYILIRNNKKQVIKNKKGAIINSQNNYLTDDNPMINIILDIKNDTIAKNLLGCFYIDQEKGWTLLNRGKVINNIRFNIEYFLLTLVTFNEYEDYLEENKILEESNKKLNFLLKEMSTNYIYKNIISENKSKILNDLNSLEEKKDILEEKIFQKNKELNNLLDILKENQKFVEKIENLGIIIEHKGESIIINKENLKGYNFNEELINLRIKELEFEVSNFNDNIKEIQKQIKKIKNENEDFFDNTEITNFFYLLKESNLSKEKLILIKESNMEKIKKNKKIYRETLNKIYKEYWDILQPILNDLPLLKEYKNNEKIITTHNLKGMAGSQKHLLSFAFKVALNKLIEKKLDIKLPFIIDSPRESETVDEVYKNMEIILEKYLPQHQIIISSVYNDFKFKNKIEIEDGIFKTLKNSI